MQIKGLGEQKKDALATPARGGTPAVARVGEGSIREYNPSPDPAGGRRSKHADAYTALARGSAPSIPHWTQALQT